MLAFVGYDMDFYSHFAIGNFIRDANINNEISIKEMAP